MYTKTNRVLGKTNIEFRQNMINFNLLKLIIFVLLMLFLSGCAQPEQHSMIFFGGDIITMSDTPSSAIEAVFVQNGRVISLGSRDEVFKLKTDQTKLINLKGKTLMPGFIAVHTHPDLAAYLYSFVDISGFTLKTKEEVWSKLQQAVKGTEKGKWIFCKGFDPMLIKGLKAA